MSDWPGVGVPPLFITSFSQWATPAAMAGATSTTIQVPASMAWGGANTACFVPFSIPWAYPVNRMFWVNGATIAGNTDVGIYTEAGARIYSTGSTVSAGASLPQYDTGTPFLLGPGSYYMAYVNDGTTGRTWGSTAVTAAAGRFMGLQQMASALPLPATATLAQWAIIGLPLFGFTRTTSGF